CHAPARSAKPCARLRRLPTLPVALGHALVVRDEIVELLHLARDRTVDGSAQAVREEALCHGVDRARPTEEEFLIAEAGRDRFEVTASALQAFGVAEACETLTARVALDRAADDRR